MRRRAPYLPLLLMSLILSNCTKKESPRPSPNPEELILSKETEVSLTLLQDTVEEGEDLVFDLKLSHKIDAEITIQINMIVDTVVNFIAPEDYAPFFSSSIDGGKNWTEGGTSQVIVPAKTEDLKIRLQTIDDDHLEVHEEMYIEWMIEEPADILLHGDLYILNKIKVLDNEKEVIPHQQNWLLAPVTLVYRTNEDYSDFELIKMERKAVLREEKMLLDQFIAEGIPEVYRQTLRNLYRWGPYRVNEIGLNLRPSASWVVNTSSEKIDYEQWSVVINLFHHYYYPHTSINEDNQEIQEFTRIEDEFIFNPYYFQRQAYTEIHEYGHVITLDNSMRIYDSTVDDPRIPPAAGCNELLTSEGCIRQSSLFAGFLNAFYEPSSFTSFAVPRKVIPEPAFVSDYATVHFIEDLAESFTYYIIHKEIPAIDTNSSGSEKKMHFFTQFPEVEAYKKKLWSTTDGFTPMEFTYTEKQAQRFKKENIKRECTLHQHGDRVLDKSF